MNRSAPFVPASSEKLNKGRISVVICTHNPRPDYLRRVLDALKEQTLPKEEWELLLIDNASIEPLTAQWDLSWQPQSWHILEDELGLTPARLRGAAESKGDPIIFVDDDNVLSRDYLEVAARIGRDWPILGAWGSNRIVGDFEVTPPDWMIPRLGSLCIHEFDSDFWGNSSKSMDALPVGAGLCVRRAVVEAYSRAVAKDSLRRRMDRTGKSLLSAGDLDLALTACDLGLGVGRFRDLALTHIIPAVRLTEDYFERMCEGNGYSRVMLQAFRGVFPAAPPPPAKIGAIRRGVRAVRKVLRPLRKIFRKTPVVPRDYRFIEADQRGAARAAVELANGFSANALPADGTRSRNV